MIQRQQPGRGKRCNHCPHVTSGGRRVRLQIAQFSETNAPPRVLHPFAQGHKAQEDLAGRFLAGRIEAVKERIGAAAKGASHPPNSV